MASACLPFLFQAVEIEGEAYWDGGYMGNPAIFPLIYSCETPDVLIIHINPIERPDVPRTATVTASANSELVLRGIERDEFIPAVTGHGEAAEVADAVVERWLSLG